MNKRFAICLLLLSSVAFGQDEKAFDATIVVTYPALTKSTGVDENVLNSFKLTDQEKAANKPDTLNMSSASARRTEIKESEFLNGTDFFAEFSSRLNTCIGFNLISYFEELVSYPVLQKADSNNTFKNITAREKTNWLIVLKSVILSCKDNVYAAEASVCVYNSMLDTIILDKSYTLQSINHGSMYACREGDPDCLINDFVYQCSDDILNAMLVKKEYWIKK